MRGLAEVCGAPCARCGSLRRGVWRAGWLGRSGDQLDCSRAVGSVVNSRRRLRLNLAALQKQGRGALFEAALLKGAEEGGATRPVDSFRCGEVQAAAESGASWTRLREPAGAHEPVESASSDLAGLPNSFATKQAIYLLRARMVCAGTCWIRCTSLLLSLIVE